MINFQINLESFTFEKKKVFMNDLYPELGNDYFSHDPFVLQDDQGNYYQMESVIDFPHIVEMSNESMYSTLKRIDHNLFVTTQAAGGYGEIRYDDIPSFRKKLIKALNSSKTTGVQDPAIVGNFIDYGISDERIVRNIQKMLEVAIQAQERKLDIFWA